MRQHRIRYRHHRFDHCPGLKAYFGLVTAEQLARAAAARGQPVSQRPERARAVTVCVIERRIRQGGLEAWAEVARGYAFCSHRDQFSRKRGRQLAERRAMKEYIAS